MNTTGMVVTLALLTVFALIAAIGAISRVQSRNQQTANQSASKPSTSADPSSGLSVQDAQVADRPQLQPDLDSIEVSTASINENTSELPTDFSVIPPFVPQPGLEIPLATSLKVSDVVHPTETQPEINFHSQTISPLEDETPSIIEEISQLEVGDGLLDRLTHQAQDSDSTMRVAVAATLGEIAAQGQYRDQAIALLNQLSQDVDPQVRVQATASLGMIPPDLPNAIV